MTTPSLKKESERRPATIMFADISGFTAMSERMDAEEVTSVMNDCFDMLGEIVKANEGTIDKFIGDCIMVVFGVPTAIEYASHKALNTAISMRNDLYEFNKKRKLAIPLDIHIGVNTGEVVAGAIGSRDKMDQTVMGDAVNLASRLEDVSARGQILVGPLTYKETKDIFEYRTLAPVSVKGKSDPIAVFELLSGEPVRIKEAVFSDRMITSELVGRENELGQLHLLFRDLKQGKGAIANLIGEAGIGKSRLVAELRESEDIQGITLLEGRALSTGRTLSFYPISDALKMWFTIGDHDSESEMAAKLIAGVSAIAPHAVEEYVPYLATMLGLRLTGTPIKATEEVTGEALTLYIQRAVRSLLEQVSIAGPIVIIMEDLQWADDSSLELLESLFKLALTRPIVFLNVFRPDYAETGERIVQTTHKQYAAGTIDIVLEALDSDGSELLVRNLLKTITLPEKFRQHIVRKSGGNPFFLEEVIRSLIDRGYIRLQHGTYQPTVPLSEAIIPSSIFEVIMSRIDSLEEETKELLRTASVIGRAFFYSVLVRITAVTDIDTRLMSLHRLQIIRSRSRMDQVEYLFKHALAQEAVYRSILLQTRKRLHQLVGSTIETLFTERIHEFYGMIAYHYTQAEDWENAEKYLIAAGEAALASSASREALEFSQQALHLYQRKAGTQADPEKIATLERTIGIAYHNIGLLDSAAEHFIRALEVLGVQEKNKTLPIILNIVLNYIAMVIKIRWGTSLRLKEPSSRENTVMELYFLLQDSYTFNATKRMMIGFGLFKLLRTMKVNKPAIAVRTYSFMALAVCFSGLSARIPFRLLAKAREELTNAAPQLRYFYEASRENIYFALGDWTLPYDVQLEADTLKAGELFVVFDNLCFLLARYIELGSFTDVETVLSRVKHFAETYEHEHAHFVLHFKTGKYLVKRRRFQEALPELTEALTISQQFRASGETDFIVLGSLQVRCLAAIGDWNGLSALIEQLDECLKHQGFADILTKSYYWSARLFAAVIELERATARPTDSVVQPTAARPDESMVQPAAVKNSLFCLKKAVASVRKVAQDRAEVYRLAGNMYYLRDNYSRAFSWWEKSLKEGRRLGAKLELSRTCFEIGRRLLDPACQRSEFEGKDAAAYIEEAEQLFRDMNLEVDLEALSRLRQ